MFIDTHLHLIDRKHLRYPWLAGETVLNADFLYADYALQARRVGIEATLHMEVDVAPSQMEAESRMIQSLAGEPGSLIRGAIAACRPEDDSFPSYLERQEGNPFIKGFRRVLHVMPDALLDNQTVHSNMRRLNGSRLTFDLCVVPRQLEKAAKLVDLAPDTTFILDHCGVPAIASGEATVWRQQITEMATRPNVMAKISGIVAYADAASWDVETLRPYVEHVAQTFGFDRLVWGSDWPVCTLGGGLSTWVAATHALFAGCSAQEREKVYSANARRIWGL
ncbi:amidohydrolase [Rhizobium sp. CFBP 8762]|uniref:amidohydrolase family protein n=1 Tax=Rhizobium sp. CFBP 8762 TaxID=2775279 RepID=UPI00177CC00E|nr:amidohydrolase [Rhizobium sp. CFBP 8762]MBD8553735.1 amidohydrolase [Rhizobium sp. CFBP 8762]